VFFDEELYRYYSKRPFIRDPRLALLPAEFFVGKRVLDVGCNEGWVTCEIGRLSLAQFRTPFVQFRNQDSPGGHIRSSELILTILSSELRGREGALSGVFNLLKVEISMRHVALRPNNNHFLMMRPLRTIALTIISLHHANIAVAHCPSQTEDAVISRTMLYSEQLIG
jgi:hypothetical protein